MSDAVERVARAIMKAALGNDTQDEWQNWENEARAAIAAMDGEGVRDQAVRALELAIESRRSSDTVEMNAGDLAAMLGLIRAR